MNQWQAWVSDLQRYRQYERNWWASETLFVVTLYRIQRALTFARPRVLWLPLRAAMLVIKKVATVITHIHLPPHAEIGPGLWVVHVGAIKVHEDVIIGKNCTLLHGCTVGGARHGAPVLGDDVFVGCNASILGPVRIGDRVQIGGGAVVVDDMPSDCTVVGPKAKAILRKSVNDQTDTAEEKPA